MIDAEIAIVGAGPAGSSAAIHARRAGRSVVLIDKADFPRDKICGDGLTTAALRELAVLGVNPTVLESWMPVTDLSVRAGNGYTASYQLKASDLRIGVVMRRELDHHLVQAAQATGAATVFNSPVSAIAHEDGAVAIAAGTNQIRVRHVIAADGMWSPTRKLVEPPQEPYLGEFHAFRQYFGEVIGTGRDHMIISFDDQLLPGYFWSFPLSQGRANVGFGIRREPGVSTKTMKSMWEALLATEHVQAILGPNAEPLERHYAWPIPCRPLSLSLSHRSILFAGDAAATCDVLTGEGIGQALLSGAARRGVNRIVLRLPDLVARRYGLAMHRHFAADHRMATWLSRAVSHRKGVRYALKTTQLNEWTRHHFTRWLFEDIDRGYLFRPTRWRQSWNAGLPTFD